MVQNTAAPPQANHTNGKPLCISLSLGWSPKRQVKGPLPQALPWSLLLLPPSWKGNIKPQLARVLQCEAQECQAEDCSQHLNGRGAYTFRALSGSVAAIMRKYRGVMCLSKSLSTHPLLICHLLDQSPNFNTKNANILSCETMDENSATDKDLHKTLTLWKHIEKKYKLHHR